MPQLVDEQMLSQWLQEPWTGAALVLNHRAVKQSGFLSSKEHCLAPASRSLGGLQVWCEALVEIQEGGRARVSAGRSSRSC